MKNWDQLHPRKLEFGELVLEMQSSFKAGAKSGTRTVGLTRQLCRCKKMAGGAFKVLIGTNLTGGRRKDRGRFSFKADDERGHFKSV